MNNSTKIKRIFAELPSSKLLSTSKGNEKFGERINKIYQKEEEKELKEIANILYAKLISDDPNNSWTVKDYKEFRKIFATVDIQRITIIGTSIKKCLETPNSEILQELNLFSQQNEWYPEKEKIKDETNNKFIYKEKDINLSDCFYIINTLTSYMYQFIRQYAGKVTKEFIVEEEVTNIINQVQDDFLKNFENKFQFITNYPLFKDVYIKAHQESLKNLAKYIYIINSDISSRKTKYTKYGANSLFQKHTAPLRTFSKAYKKRNSN